MSKKFLGDEFDVHGGGIDLLFPHHENEIAQSRCANDTKIFAKFWMHNAFITVSNEKMAKSQGNILKIKDFRNKISGQVLRLALLSAHYKQPLDWNDKLLDDCQNTINKWYNSYLDIENNFKVSDEILQPLYDDLNTPGYIANLHQLYDKAQKGNNEDKSLFVSACQFVGLLNESKENWLKFKIRKARFASLFANYDILGTGRLKREGFRRFISEELCIPMSNEEFEELSSLMDDSIPHGIKKNLSAYFYVTFETLYNWYATLKGWPIAETNNGKSSFL